MGEDQQGEKRPPQRVRWYQSWIIRAALFASLVILCGYVTSAIIAIQSIESISNLAHQEDIESTLADHLSNILNAHNLQRQLIKEKLKPYVLQGEAELARDKEAAVERWLREALQETMPDLSQTTIEPYVPKVEDGPGSAPSSIPDQQVALAWLDRDHLRIRDYVVQFPKGPLYESFKAAENVRQRYQVIGAKLDQSIRPALIRYNTLILLVSFILLASIFMALAQRFRRKVQDVIRGFLFWSEQNEDFRFDDSFTGELALITQQFNAMADEVEVNKKKSLYLEKIASWQIIARKLAHEIKNPLTPIQMMVSQLARRYKGEDAEFGALLTHAQTIISEEVQALRRMVDNFSDFARLPLPEPKLTDLVALCRHVTEMQSAAYAQHQIRFAPSRPEMLAVVDLDLLRQVLLNLVKNAAEASEGRQAVIDIALKETDSAIFITVTDDGPGIPEDVKDRIFEAYFTTKHTGPTAGMGLGLAVCQKIVIDHGGKMNVSSSPGHTRFVIQLPKKPSEEGQHGSQ